MNLKDWGRSCGIVLIFWVGGPHSLNNILKNIQEVWESIWELNQGQRSLTAVVTLSLLYASLQVLLGFK